jgi:hypothetical protein
MDQAQKAIRSNLLPINRQHRRKKFKTLASPPYFQKEVKKDKRRLL